MRAPSIALAALLLLGCEERWERRHAFVERLAHEWVESNGIKGRIACPKFMDRCDVVPEDARPPFSLECHAEADHPFCQLARAR